MFTTNLYSLIGYFLVQWDGQQELGRFCEASKLAKLLQGVRGSY